jgi:hypothetical protein
VVENRPRRRPIFFPASGRLLLSITEIKNIIWMGFGGLEVACLSILRKPYLDGF